MKFSKISKIIKDAKRGKMFILVDDEQRENEGDLIVPASKITPKLINFMARHGRGLICLTICQKQADKLNLSLINSNTIARSGTAFTISIDAKKGISTGISAHDRSKTIKTAIKKNSNPKDFVSPGHIFPIIAKNGGVLVRSGHTEASVDISKLSNQGSSAVICEIMNNDGSMAKGKSLFKFSKKHKINIGRIDDLISFRLKSENLIKFRKISTIKISNEVYTIKIFENSLDGSEHFALIKGNIKRNRKPRVRVISSNVVQNYLMSKKLPNSFNKTINHFKKHKDCVLIFIKDANLRSVSETLKAYKNKKFYKNLVKLSSKSHLEMKGYDKLIKNYGIGAQIIRNLGIKSMILVTRSKKRIIGLEGYGIKIAKQEIIK
jgi:3,4-dihydroxy 2-butanone 4-phosphate synthase/GTP cyclohydrolase II